MRKRTGLAVVLLTFAVPAAVADVAPALPAPPGAEATVTAFLEALFKFDYDAALKLTNPNAVSVDATGTTWKLDRKKMEEKGREVKGLLYQFGITNIKVLGTDVRSLGSALCTTTTRISLQAQDGSEVSQANVYTVCVRNYEGWRVLVASVER